MEVVASDSICHENGRPAAVATVSGSGASQMDKATFYLASTDASLSPSDQLAYAGAHMALFLRWGLQVSGPSGTYFRENNLKREALMVCQGEMTGSDFLRDFADWRLFRDMFGRDLHPFIRTYYGGRGLYLADMDRVTQDGDFGYAEVDVDFFRYFRMVQTRFAYFCAEKDGPVRQRNALSLWFGKKPHPAIAWRKLQ